MTTRGINDRVVTAQTLFALTKCERQLYLRAHAPEEAAPESDFRRDLRERGRAHEDRVRGLFPGHLGPIRRFGHSLDDAAHETLRLLRETRATLYQPVLRSRDGGATGIPDFLYWEDGRVVICDAKLAESLEGKDGIRYELTHYAHLLEDAAGIVPLRLEIVSGRGERLDVRPIAEPAYRAAVARARTLLGDAPEPDVLLAHSTCESCAFYEHCWSRAEAAHRLEVLPSVHRYRLDKLAGLGVTTMETLAATDPVRLAHTRGIGKAGPPMVAEARAFLTREPVWLGPPRLPRARPRIWFDLEADTTDEDFGVHVYLWGIARERGDQLESEMTFSDGGPDRDREVWGRFVALASGWLEREPHARWVHYADYERTWVKEYVRRHGAPAGFEQRLLGAMFDLHKEVVAPLLRLPLRSYGIKHVARFAGFAWRNPESGSQWSIAHYRRARAARTPEERERLLREIGDYNLDDLLAMRAVWDWIERTAPAE